MTTCLHFVSPNTQQSVGLPEQVYRAVPGPTGSQGASLKFTSPLTGVRDILNTEVLAVDEDLRMQKKPLFAYEKQKGREAGGLGESHRKQVPWSPGSGPARSW